MVQIRKNNNQGFLSKTSLIRNVVITVVAALLLVRWMTHESNNLRSYIGLEPSPIPKHLIFSHSHDILQTKEPKLLYENVLHTIRTYKRAWGTDPPVRFLTPQNCRWAVEAAAPELLTQFDNIIGPFQGDLCRLAALYELGGYYFDIDVRTVKPVKLKDGVQFSTALEPSAWREEDGDESKDNFFQGFVATRAKHPILKEALELMRVHHDGTKTLRRAYDKIQQSRPCAKGTLHFLQEDSLDNIGEDYPRVARQSGAGCCCNNIVHDPVEPKIYFYSSIPLPPSYRKGVSSDHSCVRVNDVRSGGAAREFGL